MRRPLLAILLLLVMAFSVDAGYVRSYTRKDGTHVSGYYRSSSGRSSSYRSYSSYGGSSAYSSHDYGASKPQSSIAAPWTTMNPPSSSATAMPVSPVLNEKPVDAAPTASASDCQAELIVPRTSSRLVANRPPPMSPQNPFVLASYIEEKDLLAAAASHYGIRRWSDSDNHFSVFAKLFRASGSDVQLYRFDRHVLQVQFAQLSKDDQAYVRASMEMAPNSSTNRSVSRLVLFLLPVCAIAIVAFSRVVRNCS